ncbi:hypothetical protein [Halorubrum distributum]|uniref:COMM domain-containing protein n=1 Tax=Halorubrum distributum JCM 10247 TaxID=1227486 RepID=M0D615_9EURY|nr:hypothetical protein [Halorubrum terrestre]ELZ30122.1 hypothetical protein C473_13429 [Halorubrum terrestre JCM 10247]
MTDSEPKLMFLGGEEATSEVRSDASKLSGVSPSQFDSLCEELFDEENLFDLLFADTEGVAEFGDSIGVADEQLAGIFNLLRAVITNAAKHDLIESQIQQDLSAIDIQEERAEELAERISTVVPGVRQALAMSSGVDPLPALKQFNWSIEKTVTTPRIDGASLHRVFFELTYGRDEDDTETVRFQTGEEDARYLVSQIAQLSDALSTGIDDIEQSNRSE